MLRSLLAVSTLLLLMSPCNNTAAQDCKRDCLAEKLDVYLDAVMHHDLTAAPLASGFRQTENAVVKKPGDGMWRSATALGKVQRRFFDPVTAQAAYFGLVEEGDTAAIVAVRLQVQHDQITEAEWYIGRRGDPGINGPANAEGQGATLYDVDNLIANPPPERTVPPGKRLPREALIAITNSYFDGITSHDGTIILAHPGCVRVENGFLTTQRPIPADWNDQGVNGVTDCTSGMGNFQIALVAGRRYPLVDEAAQVVLGTAVFLRDPGSERRRNSFSEFFFIDEGRIRHIYAAMFYPAPGRPVPNWPPYDGNFPLPAALMQEVQ